MNKDGAQEMESLVFSLSLVVAIKSWMVVFGKPCHRNSG